MIFWAETAQPMMTIDEVPCLNGGGSCIASLRARERLADATALCRCCTVVKMGGRKKEPEGQLSHALRLLTPASSLSVVFLALGCFLFTFTIITFCLFLVCASSSSVVFGVYIFRQADHQHRSVSSDTHLDLQWCNDKIIRRQRIQSR